MNQGTPSRRGFLKASALSATTAAFGTAVPSSVLGANDRINIAFIGTGGRGSGLMRDVVRRSEEENVKVVAVCDVFRKRLDQAKAASGGDDYMDYRKIIDRKDIDAVVIATPDHWHSKMSIEAMESGKDVYCEKPMTLNCEQAIEVRDAVKRTGRVMQVGPQRTSQDKWWNAHEMISKDRLGKVTWAQGSWNRNNRGNSVFGTSSRRDDPVGPHMTGEGYVDWDMWLGHKWDLAPRVPWHPNRFFYFRGYFDYNGGVATDLLYHYLAPIQIAIVGKDGEYPSRVNAGGGLFDNNDGREVPDVFMMNVDYPSKWTASLESVLTNEYYRPTRLYGRYGTMEFTDSTDFIDVNSTGTFKDEFRKNNDGFDHMIVPPEGGRRDMFGNFFDVIRKGGELNCNANLGATTMVAIKMAVESYRRSKTMLWDAAKEQMIEG